MSSTDRIARDRVLADLATLGTASCDAVSLLTQARDLAVFTDQVHGELARLAGIIDVSGAYDELGYSSAAAFLRHGCGRSAGRAGELVATGRALRRLTATAQALSAGQLSFDAAHVISRATAQISDDTLAADAEAQLLAAATIGLPGSRSAADALAAQPGPPPADSAPADPASADPDDGQSVPSSRPDPTTGPDSTGPIPGAGSVPDDTADRAPDGAEPSQPDPGQLDPGQPHAWIRPALDPRELRRLGEELTYRADPDAIEERQRKRFERRYLSFGLTLDDVGTISGACSDALSIEIIKTAAEAFSPPGGTEDRRTAAQRRMDGLTAACQAALDSGQAGGRHGAMPHLSVLFDARGGGGPGEDPGDTGADGPGTGRTANGTLLTAAQILTLACRAEISVIRWRDGLPLDVGRRYRTETPALRRALTARDHGCRFPGCGLPATWCTAHHIRPWQRGGTTRLPNLVLLCFVHHHYFVHVAGWIMSGCPDGALRFTHPGTGFTVTSPLPAQPTSRGP